MLTIDKNGKIMDTSTDLSRAQFYKENADRAVIGERTFYKRLEGGSYNSFEEALTVSTKDKNKVIKSTEEINKEVDDNFGETFIEGNDDLEFGEEQIKKPYGA